MGREQEPIGATPERPAPSSTRAGAPRWVALGGTTLLLLAASAWTLFAVAIPFDDGVPCGGHTFNSVQKGVAVAGWLSALSAVFGAADIHGRGRRFLLGAPGALLALMVWLLMYAVVDC